MRATGPRSRSGDAAMRSERGFSYLGLLLAVTLLGIGLVGTSEVWVTTARRQKLNQLEWAGLAYQRAIGSYYESAFGGGKTFPRQLEDLLEDRRQGWVRRHLRQLYRNPFTQALDWELIKAGDGAIHGVRAQIPAADGSGPIVREFVYVPLRS